MRNLFWFAVVCATVFFPPVSQAQPVVRVGAVTDGPGPLNQPVRQQMRESVAELTAGAFRVEFPSELTRMGDWTAESVAREMDSLLADENVDIILAMGVLASYDAARRGPLPKPVIAPFILNFDRTDIPSLDGASGVQNLSYLVLPRTFARDVEAFSEIAPVTRLALLFSEPVVEGLPTIQSSCETTLQSMGIGYQSISVGDDVQAAMSQIDPDVDAVFIMPLVHLSDEGMRELTDTLVDRRLPSFALLGRRDVELGALASLNPDIFARLARRVGLHLHNILLGDDPATMPVGFAAGERLTLNVETADRIGLAIDWGVRTQADLVGEHATQPDRVVSLDTVALVATQANRDLVAKRREVAAGAHRVGAARGILFPQVEVGATHLTIDEDRASPFGAPERALTGSVGFSQLIWSEAAHANHSIQRALQASREGDLASVELDVRAAAFTAYLRVLKASSLERIQRENLQLTRSNLELAEVREMVGQSGPAEALRFQSQLATNTREAIAANAQRNVAELDLNRILNQPLESPFATAEGDLQEALAQLRGGGLLTFFRSKREFAAFRNFVVDRALHQSPELRSIDASLRAQRRSAKSATRTFWSPTLAFQAELDHRFDESGAGTDPAPPGLGLDPDDTDWSLAFALSLPLFQGGERFSVRREAWLAVAQLEAQREALAQRIEQRARAAVHLSGSSYAGIAQAERAAAAAGRSLELVVDAYGQGVVSILDLLDAQTNALIADQQAASAVFDFFLDLVEVQRALGEAASLLDPAGRESFVTEARAALAAQGLTFFEEIRR